MASMFNISTCFPTVIMVTGFPFASAYYRSASFFRFSPLHTQRGPRDLSSCAKLMPLSPKRGSGRGGGRVIASVGIGLGNRSN